MSEPIPFVVRESGAPEEAPEGSIPVTLYGGGGGAGGPIDLDASDTVIGRGHLEAAAGTSY